MTQKNWFTETNFGHYPREFCKTCSVIEAFHDHGPSLRARDGACAQFRPSGRHAPIQARK